MPSSLCYPKPQHIGGTLVRHLVQFLRWQGIALPIQHPVWIAFSGGIDSTALVHCIRHFGRRILEPSQIHLLHINHRWRGEKSDQEAQWVMERSKEWNLPLKIFQLASPAQLQKNHLSWEEVARMDRKKIYAQVLKDFPTATIWTAHQADDLAETLIWRLGAGQWTTHSSGIRFFEKGEQRPLLSVRKKVLKKYLEENSLSEGAFDETNFSPRFLRGRMRTQLLPSFTEIFPKGLDYLAQWALYGRMSKVSLKREILSGPF